MKLFKEILKNSSLKFIDAKTKEIKTRAKQKCKENMCK